MTGKTYVVRVSEELPSRNNRWIFFGIIFQGCLLASFFTYQLFNTPVDSSISSPTEAAVLVSTKFPGASEQEYLPVIVNPPSSNQTRKLAYIRSRDLWLADVVLDSNLRNVWFEETLPDQKQHLTEEGKVVSFAWSPDGQRIAAFDGQAVHFLLVDPKQVTNQVGLPIPQRQVDNIPVLVWAQDNLHLLILNLNNPWEGVPVGGYIIRADGSGTPKQVPGRAVKMMALADDTLIGTLEKPCGQATCPLGLYRYDSQSEEFVQFDLDRFNEQGGLGILNASVFQNLLTGTAHVECGYYSDAPDSLTLGPRPQNGLLKAKDTPYDFLLAPDGSRILAARGAACNDSIPIEWETECWPNSTAEDYNMVLLDGQSGKQTDLVPGVFADWSPDSKWVTFQSCLAATPFGLRVDTDKPPPWIFVMDTTTGTREGINPTIRPIAEGYLPAWRPQR